jgi:TPR repeat protein
VKAAILFFSLCLPAAADLAAGLQAFDKGDYATALREFLPLAKQGNSETQFHLGLLYHEGHGVPQDYVEALRWYRKAAEQGAATAQNNLGTMYGDGHGVPQDYAEAVSWYGEMFESLVRILVAYRAGTGKPISAAAARNALPEQWIRSPLFDEPEESHPILYHGALEHR